MSKALLTQEQRDQVVKMLRDGERTGVIARQFGVPDNCICTIKRRLFDGDWQAIRYEVHASDDGIYFDERWQGDIDGKVFSLTSAISEARKFLAEDPSTRVTRVYDLKEKKVVYQTDRR